MVGKKDTLSVLQYRCQSAAIRLKGTFIVDTQLSKGLSEQ